MPVARNAIMNSINDGVIVLNTQDRIVDINPAMQQIIGHSSTGVAGKSITESLHGWPDLVECCHDMTWQCSRMFKAFFQICIQFLSQSG